MNAEAGTSRVGWPRRIGRGIVALFSSYGLAVVVLLLLLVLTYLGTLAQRTDNLYNVQKRYFESLFVVESLGSVPIPIPGAYLLLAILFVNLLVGGIVRVRKSWSRAGILITHVGILLLLIAGFIEFRTSTKGYLAIEEPEPFEDLDRDGSYTAGEPFEDRDKNGAWTPGSAKGAYASYYEWDLTLTPVRTGTRTQTVLPFEELERAVRDRVRFEGGGLPFPIEVREWTANAEVVRAPPGTDAGVGGLALKVLPEHPEKKERNRPALVVRLLPPGREPIEHIAWAGALAPFRVTVGDTAWDVDLDKRTWALPFQVRLDRFVHRNYPGTNMPREYSSHITKIEGSVIERRHITMNEPLRHRGHTLYQSSYEIQNTPSGPRYLSVLAVVRNPADRIPEIACWILFIGLSTHWLMRLVRYLRSESRRRASA